MKTEFKTKIQSIIDNKTKPLGSLGVLETIALQLAVIQNTDKPKVDAPFHTVFAGDHGICSQNVNAFPQEVSAQMVGNFLNQGAAINAFCDVQLIAMQVVNMGVKHFDENITHKMLINKPIAKGTEDFSQTQAMTEEQCKKALNIGHKLISLQIKEGANLISLGEMGIGNTTTAAALMAKITDLDVEQCTGMGTGSDAQGIKRKNEVIKQALVLHAEAKTGIEILQCLGGFEIAGMVGAILCCYENNTPVMIDGFIASAAALVAMQMQPESKQNMIFAHCSNENGHKKMLDFMQVTPLLDLGLRLGEGTGAVLAIPIVQSAASFLNNMASFDDAQVSNKDA
ncbi:nicotinate-nucleotide--dimethylbenzimidazole phosphoribosyltransferase [Marinicellulosiphila megalodicopiae]|uniref:nicotinate-nucleotide--dimethylbenzimidazole phosphoribosyltransferase n=1 Tax=Marinicellulosiphila megalodicopiae TaxID=2724896 RepID=UPI003BB0618C